MPSPLNECQTRTSLNVPPTSTCKSDVCTAWFAANAFIGTITPVKNGGIPHYAELKLTFKDGGAFEFYNCYTTLLDRLHDGQDGAPVDHLEDLPVYSNEPTTQEAQETHDAPVAVEAGDLEDAPPAYDVVASDDGRTGRSRTRG